MPNEMIFKKHGGHTLAARQWGKPPYKYIFVHGGLANSSWWLEIMRMLDQPAVALDLPGMGWSGYQECYSLDLYADAIASLIDGQAVTLVGHSLVAPCCYRGAVKYPDTVKSMCFMDPFLQGWRTPVDWVRVKRKLIHKVMTKDEIYQRFRLTPAQPHPSDDIMLYLAKHAVRRVKGGYVWLFDPDMGLKAESLNPSLLQHRCEHPISIVVADHSQVCQPDDVAYFRDLNTQTILHHIDAHHAFILDHPAESLRFIKMS